MEIIVTEQEYNEGLAHFADLREMSPRELINHLNSVAADISIRAMRSERARNRAKYNNTALDRRKKQVKNRCFL